MYGKCQIVVNAAITKLRQPQKSRQTKPRLRKLEVLPKLLLDYSESYLCSLQSYYRHDIVVLGNFIRHHKDHYELWNSIYDSLSDVGEIRVYQRADFQSGSRVLKKVFWTFSYLYLWHTMWFHAKKLLRTLKFWKSLNSLCKSGSRPQKSPKKAQKTDHSIAIYSNFWIGMVYFGCHLVNPHVQTVQNMYGKWG